MKKTFLESRSAVRLTPRGRRVLSLARSMPALRTSLVLAGLAVAGSAQAAPATIPAASRVETTPRTGNGDGLCTQFAAAAANGSVSTSAQAIALIAQSDPRCVITVRESGSFGLAAGLHDGSFDLVVGRLVPEYFRSAVNLEPLFEEELLVICRSGHPLAKAPTLTWREAAKYPWMLPPKESPISHAIQSQFLADGVQGPAVIVEAFSIPLALGMLQSCDAMTVLPSRLARALRDKGEVSILSLRSPRLPAPMGVAWRKDSPLSPLASAFIAALKTCAGEQP